MGIQRGTRGYKGLQRTCTSQDTFKLQGVTRSYRGLQGVTRGYRGLEKVRRGLQGVTGGYKKLQGLTEDNRRLAFLTSTSPDTFSWSILHKNQS